MLETVWPGPKFRPYVQALVGASDVRVNAHSFSQWETSFAEVFTAGLEYHFSDHLAWQVDTGVLQTHLFANTQNNFRFSLGPVIRFGHKH